MRDGERVAPSEVRNDRRTDDLLLVHVHVSRTGGSTLNHILRSSYGARHCPVEPWDSRWGTEPFTADDLAKLRKIYPRLKSVAGHRLYGYVDLATPGQDAAYFAMVRDPVRACASRFQHKVLTGDKNMGDLESWLAKDWTRNRHTKAIVGHDDVKAAIRLIREKSIFMGLTERYDASMILLRRLVAADLDISYRPVNVASRRTVSEEVLSDERARKLIEEAQAADLELHRYVREVLWPEYIDEYGADFDADVEAFAAERGDFNDLNIARSRLKAYALYKPALYLHRLRNRGR